MRSGPGVGGGSVAGPSVASLWRSLEATLDLLRRGQEGSGCHGLLALPHEASGPIPEADAEQDAQDDGIPVRIVHPLLGQPQVVQHTQHADDVDQPMEPPPVLGAETLHHPCGRGGGEGDQEDQRRDTHRDVRALEDIGEHLFPVEEVIQHNPDRKMQAGVKEGE